MIPKPIQGAQARMRRFRVGALVVIVLAVGLILWLVLRDNRSSSTSRASANTTAVSVDQLRALATSVGHPVFWVGPKQGYTYELTRTSNGSIFLRYLPPGAKVGATKPYLSVATYPFPGAFAAIQAVLNQSGSTAITLLGNGLAEVSAQNHTSIHIAYPTVDYQVEVFDPTPETARALVTAGQLAAFGSLGGSTAAPKPTAASLADLASLASSLGHPVYWAGPKKGYTYELTQTARGQVYIRYLPPGTNVGASGQFLTIGTYPFPKAFEATQGLAKQANVVTINLAGGGLAVIDTSYRKSIHLAYPGSNYQVEVYDPSPAVARQLVSSGRVKSIG